MPIVTNPAGRFELCLKSDADRPDDERAEFIFRPPTVREWKRLDAALKGFGKTGDSSAELDELLAALACCLVDWRNVVHRPGCEPLEFREAQLEELVAPSEALELAYKVIGRGLGVTDEKKSASPSRSTGAGSAPDAAAGDSAATARPPGAPSLSTAPDAAAPAAKDAPAADSS